MSAIPILYDDDAATDEPTRATALILVSAVGQTDLGQRRKNNEDSYLVLEELGVFVVADGMGGYAGGEIASQLAVDVIEGAFRASTFEGEPYPTVPRRGSELAQAIQSANEAIFKRAQANRELAEMGTTIVGARFSPNKQRLYIGHVGDSRCYRLRQGELTQITTDHTMAALGMKGPYAHRLNRAVGIAPRVKIDLIIARPQPDDVYVLCSDGLSKMIHADTIRDTLLEEQPLQQCVASLIDQANANGGRDNITVVLVAVKSPVDIARNMS
jgi:protein phosphatase